MKRYWKLSLAIFATLIVGLIAGSSINAYYRDKTPQNSSTQPSEPTRAQLLTLVNAERARNGVAALKEDPRLDASAQMKASDEIVYNYFGHISPKDHKQGYLYINDTGISCIADSENLAEIWPITAQEAIKQWVDSPLHHQAMINLNYSLTGFGIDQNEIVEHFCQQ